MSFALAEPAADPMEAARDILRHTFGYAEFRGRQAEVIGEVLAGRSALAVLPTGGGKSLCYQIPALVRPGLGLVVSPLIALMTDQVAALQQSGVAAARLDSNVDPAEKAETWRRIEAGELDLLYVSPEGLMAGWMLERLRRTPLALIAVYCALTLPFSIWLLQAYFRTMPVELEEAAVIDGASRWQTIRSILLPLSMPGLTCVAILAFMGSWSEFLFAVTFGKTIASRTLPVVAASFVDTSSIQFDYVMAAGVITALPPFLLALVFQRFIVGGLSSGAVKG